MKIIGQFNVIIDSQKAYWLEFFLVEVFMNIYEALRNHKYI